MSLIRLQKNSHRYQMSAASVVAQASRLCVRVFRNSQARSLCHYETDASSFALKKLDATFPLTLTLSLGEREQPLDIFLKPNRNRAEISPRFAKARRAVLPLPRGEGRGEGKENSISATSIRIENNLSIPLFTSAATPTQRRPFHHSSFCLHHSPLA